MLYIQVISKITLSVCVCATSLMSLNCCVMIKKNKQKTKQNIPTFYNTKQYNSKYKCCFFCRQLFQDSETIIIRTFQQCVYTSTLCLQCFNLPTLLLRTSIT